uniref:UDP-glucuronate decarboxylase n=1 Tax=Ditylum brightwellii TaxID=49249 RepID=A0A7S4SN56_9STRA|mmetsp:Transcript_13857/g.18547  ORF Transcript_13857/g.18547 Transcript_13857/m.18547 type:complete len:371 (+) Transcript_13857:89-1201(+)
MTEENNDENNNAMEVAADATPSTDLLRAMGKFQRVLVTGGAGFLGRHLCRRLIRDGHEVICLDNYFTSQKKDIEDLVSHKNFELVRHDVTNPMQFEVDQIYNLACPASPVHYQYNPIKTCKTSFMGAMNVLGLAKRVKARVLQASTSEVYGDPDRSPQQESYWGNVNPIGVRACYDEGKRVAETMFFAYHNQNNVDIRVVRIFNTYGPGMHPFDGRVVSNFIMQALRNEDITIYGDGSQTRSFCFVDDLVEAMVRMMAQEDDVGPVNIGNPNEFSIKELAEAVLELIPESKSEIKYLPLPGDDPKQRKPDIAKARKIIGWEPKVQLKEGLSQTIAYFKNLDMGRYKKPTDHTAHENTEKQSKKRKLEDGK